jgi:formamidopyrimidine-DNA glycosylase
MSKVPSRLQASCARQRIIKLGGDADIIRDWSPQGLGRAFKGRSFREPRRHGKWLICPTDKPLLLFHFGMTGV